MKKGLIFSFFVLGFSSIVAQAVILRELIISFYGNEFFVGIVLASWLLWVAIGSEILGKILNRFKKILPILISLQFLVGVVFFLEIFLIRFLKIWIGLPGEIPNLIYGILSGFLIPVPLGLILGWWWTTASRIFSGFYPKAKIWSTNRAYLLEILGFILGGVLFSLVLINYQEFLIAVFLIFLNFWSAFLLIFQKKYLWLKLTILFLALAFSVFIFWPYLINLNQITISFRFENQKLMESVNSPYGNIAVTKINNQKNFYESGLLLGSDQEIQFSEKLVHLSLLQHPDPQKVLLIGGGFNGAINEILKHPVENFYYLELDPKLIEISKKYISPQFKKALTDPKVRIISADGRHFLKKTIEKFDVIILNLPDPSTLLINRFYTQEFFEEAKQKLNPGGIFSIYLTFTPSTPGKNLENLNASIFKTLKKVFNQVIILPEYSCLFLGSLNGNLTHNPEILIQRFKERKIETKFLTKEYLKYRLTLDQINFAQKIFEENKVAKENRDFKPVSYFYQILFWLDHFNPRFSNFFKNLTLWFWPISLGILATLTLFLIRNKKKLIKIFPIFSVAGAGFSLMALQMIIIFGYQILIGYLYFRIALLISALMAGMALGVWFGNQKLKTRKVELSSLIKWHSGLILFCLILPILFLSFLKNPIPWFSEILFLTLAIGAGFLGAVIFPLSNKIYLSLQPDPHKKTGTIYAADVAGSCFGALLPSLILIPGFGLSQSLIFIVLINLWLILILFCKYLGSENV